MNQRPRHYRKLFDRKILGLFWQALRLGFARIGQLPFLLRCLAVQTRGARLRAKHLRQGLEVPPLLIFSLTRRCNLNCRGCYSKLLHTSQEEELGAERFAEILAETNELGVTIIMLAGGEPLLRRDMLEAAAKHRRAVFPVFTNGTLFDAEYLCFFRRNPHLIPVVSLEGNAFETDARRGAGVFDNFRELLPALKKERIFWGISFTLTRQNYASVLADSMLQDFLSAGCQLFFFVEYVPVAEGTEELVLSEEQKQELPARTRELSRRGPGLFIAFPGDEDQYGGCLAAGRGFLHINPSGYAEPCPFAPFADVNLRFASLREALHSPLLKKISSIHNLLTEGEGGCALWANREFVAGLTQEKQESRRT